MGKTVEELLSQISSREFTEWQALAMLETRGAQASDPAQVEKALRGIFGRPGG